MNELFIKKDKSNEHSIVKLLLEDKSSEKLRKNETKNNKKNDATKGYNFTFLSLDPPLTLCFPKAPV